MPNSTPHIENSKVDGGDRVNPVITDITNGGMDNSRIWHTKENDKFFEYRQKNVNKKSHYLLLEKKYHLFYWKYIFPSKIIT